MNNSIEYFGLYWMNIFWNEYLEILFWIEFWIESFLGPIQWKNEFSKCIGQGYSCLIFGYHMSVRRSSLLDKNSFVTASPTASPRRYVLKIHFFIEFGLKMIQFKIQFKTKSKIFIQKNIHSKQNPKYSFKKIFIQ